MTDDTPPDIPVVPRATYRLQFNAGFTFADAERLVPYLNRLGISHVYASPFLAARKGSTHGYDITDHNALNPEIGDEAAFRSFAAALKSRGMGLILDFVPNHMGIGRGDNSWWLDVLAWGQASPFARYFDIDWRPAKPELAGKVLVPMLGAHYGEVLEGGELELAFDPAAGSFHVTYYEHVFPISPPHYARILVAQRLDGEAVPETTARLAREFRALAPLVRQPRNRATVRARAEELQRSLAAAAKDDKDVADHIAACVGYFNGRAGDAESFMALHRLLQRQPYRLAFWRVAADEINYRRFFDINELAGLRVEDPELFERLHRSVRTWIAEGLVQGVRIDHIDGLYAPADYCRQLRRLVPDTRLYLLVEKILCGGETLRADWPVDGTTGYEVAKLINGLFVDPAGRETLLRTHAERTGTSESFGAVLTQAKQRVMDTLLASELQVLANMLDRIAESSWRTRDFTRNDMVRVLTGAVSALPVYRTYVDRRGAAAEDRRIIDRTIAQARRAHPEIDAGLFDFLKAVWTTDLGRRRRSGYSRNQVIACAMKLQQLTGPVMAKAMEDTSFYRYVALASLNEVGGEPDRFGVSPDAFHAAVAKQAAEWPHAMIATTTHDTKRGEDVRVRIDVLSEIADEWRSASARWSEMNRPLVIDCDGRPAPAPRDEYLLYQTLLGAWPLDDCGTGPVAEAFVTRIQTYMTKAMREAKLETSWTSPDIGYENAVATFVAAILSVSRATAFLAELRALAGRVAHRGMLNGLGQTVLKLTMPGVPDIYQGSELWDLRLVDPDNRGPVDFDNRQCALEAVQDTDPETLLRSWRTGEVKLALIARLLHHRRQFPRIYAEGAYVPVQVDGPAARNLCAFARQDDRSWLLVVVSRFLAPKGDIPDRKFWHGTSIRLDGLSLTGEAWNVLNDKAFPRTSAMPQGPIAVGDMLSTLPLCVLTGV